MVVTQPLPKLNHYQIHCPYYEQCIDKNPIDKTLEINQGKANNIFFQNFIDADGLGADTRMVLVNALYFKGKQGWCWSMHFTLKVNKDGAGQCTLL